MSFCQSASTKMITNSVIVRTVLKNGSYSNSRSLISLIIGIAIGFCTALLFKLSLPARPAWTQMLNPWQSLTWQSLIATETDSTISLQHEHLYDNETLAKKLYNETRILCWIMTGPHNHKTKAMHVKRTWGKRCNKLLIMSTKTDKRLKPIALNVTEGYNNLWAKTKAAFKYVYKHHFDDADWFLKADDDTYVILENLRYMLKSYSTTQPLFFGCRYRAFIKEGYNQGGAGYVLSKEALKRFVQKALPNPKFCRKGNYGAEDVEIAKCLLKVKVSLVDTRDEYGRHRFFPYKPTQHLMPRPKDRARYEVWFYYKGRYGMKYCSDYAISFHKLTPKDMYVLEYFMYHLRPFGIVNLHEKQLEKHKMIE